VETAEEFRFRVRDLAIGAVARIEIERGEEKVAAPVKAVELGPERTEALVERRIGIRLVEEPVGGRALLAVKTVARGSPAARVGIAPGDLVREVNSTEVTSVTAFRREAARARRSGRLVLLVQRGYAAERIAFDFD